MALGQAFGVSRVGITNKVLALPAVVSQIRLRGGGAGQSETSMLHLGSFEQKAMLLDIGVALKGRENKRRAKRG